MWNNISALFLDVRNDQIWHLKNNTGYVIVCCNYCQNNIFYSILNDNSLFAYQLIDKDNNFLHYHRNFINIGK